MKYVYTLVFFPIILFALPSKEEVVTGEASSFVSEKEMKLYVSDKTILNFKQFNIEEGETVRFIQPSSKSTVLSRVSDINPSRLMGSLQANGRVFLVNPQGIYIGPNAKIHTASFLASTVNVSDTDFLHGTLAFSLDQTNASIINEGFLSAEEFIVLVAPSIENKGEIVAHCDEILLKSSGQFVLDFTGDRLLQFTLDKASENDLQSLYKNAPHLQLQAKTAKQIIHNVVNDDGIEVATKIDLSEGKIRLLSSSKIKAPCVAIEGEKVDISGSIYASTQRQGGVVHILGNEISVMDASIKASGVKGGGTVLIGGDYQGEGNLRTANVTIMDHTSSIRADALEKGNGGKIILWADDATIFHGTISAKGGKNGGDGGFVETSGKNRLRVGKTASVTTTALYGTIGNWLLDPASVTIITGGADALSNAQSPNCATAGSFNIDPTTFTGSGSTVTICSQNATNSSITISSNIVMTTAGAGLVFNAGSTNVGTITLGANITTNNAPLTFTGAVVLSSATVTLTTVNTTGGAITFNSTINATTAGSQGLTIASGNGSVTYKGIVGGTAALGAFSATGTGAHIFNGATAFSTKGSTISFANPIQLSNSLSISSNSGAAAGANISLSGAITANSGNVYSLSVAAGTGGIFNLSANFGTTTNRLIAFSVSSASQFNLTGSVTGCIGSNGTSISAPMVISGSPSFNISDTTTTLRFNNTLNGTTAGADTLSINNNGLTNTWFNGVVGGTTPLGKISVSGVALTLCFANVNIKGDGTAATGFTLSGPLYVANTNVTISTTAGGGTGANITTGGTSFGGSNINNLTLTAGTGNVILGTFAAGASSIIRSITVSSAASLTLNGSITLNGPFSSSATTNTLGASVTMTTSSGNGAVTFASPINATTAGSQGLTISAGSGAVTFTGNVGSTTALGNVSVTTTNAAGLTLGGNLTTSSGTVGVTGALTIAEGVSSTITTSGNRGVTVSGTINGTTGGSAETLTINAPGGAISLAAVGSGVSTSLTDLTITNSADFTCSGAVNLTGALTQTNAATGTTTFSSTVSVASATLRGVAYNLNNSWASTGATSITNSGTVTKNSTGSITATGGFSTTGAMTLGSSITTTNTALTIGGALTISEAITPTLTSGSGTLTLSGLVDGTAAGSAETLTLSASGGAISLQAVGSGSSTSLTTLTVSACSTISFNGIVNLTGAVAVTNSGTATVASGANITANGGFSTTGALSLAANITTSNTALSVGGALTLASGVTPTLTSGGGTLTVTGTTNGTAGTETLTVNSGAGGTTFTGAVGGVTPFTALTATNSAALTFSQSLALSGALTQTNAATGTTTFSNTVSVGSATLRGVAYALNNSWASTGATSITNSGTVTKNSTGSITATGGFSTTGAVSLASNITTTNTALTIGGALTIAEGISPTLTSGSGTLTLSGLVDGTAGGSAETLTLSASGGAVSLQAVGSGSSTSLTTLTVSACSTISFNGIVNLTGAVAVTNSGTATVASGANITANGGFSTSGALSLAANITTSNTALSVGGALTLASGATPTLTTGGANLTITGAINGTLGTETLTLSANTGDVSLGGAIGATTPFSSLTVSNSATLTQSSTVKTIGAISYTASTQIALNGTSLTTDQGIITLTGPVSLGAATVLLDTTNTGLSAQGASIIINNAVTNDLIANHRTLSLTAGSDGDITLAGSAALAIGTPSSGMQLNFNSGNSLSLGGSIYLNNSAFTPAASMPITLTLSGTTIINTGNGAITFANTGSQCIQGTSAGASNLTLTTTGNINIKGNIGAVALGNLTISSGAASLTLDSTTTSVIARSLAINGTVPLTIGAATTTVNTSSFNGDIYLGGSLDGIVATSQNLSLQAGTGDVTFVGDMGTNYRLGSVAILSGATCTLPSQALTNGWSVSSASTQTLLVAASSTLDTNNHTVLFTGPVDGSTSKTESFVISAGTESVTFNETVGGSVPLNDLNIASASGFITDHNVYAETIDIHAPITLTGAITLDALGP